MNVVSKLFCVQVVYLCLGSLCSGMGLWVSFYYFYFFIFFKRLFISIQVVYLCSGCLF